MQNRFIQEKYKIHYQEVILTNIKLIKLFYPKKLEINENFAVNESITDYETYAFNPITGNQLNNPGSITITIQNSDNWYHMCNSWLEFEGQLVKASDGQQFAAGDKISFANNGIMFLFDNIKYLLSSAEIESVYNPGIASNILGMAKYSSNYAPGVIQCWAPDTHRRSSKTGGRSA